MLKVKKSTIKFIFCFLSPFSCFGLKIAFISSKRLRYLQSTQNLIYYKHIYVCFFLISGFYFKSYEGFCRVLLAEGGYEMISIENNTFSEALCKKSCRKGFCILLISFVIHISGKSILELMLPMKLNWGICLTKKFISIPVKVKIHDAIEIFSFVSRTFITKILSPPPSNITHRA